MNNLLNCRICESNKLNIVISLGNQRITSIFPKYGEVETIPQSPIDICLCLECGLLQLNQTSQPDEMYKNGAYGYKSGISNTMITHLKEYNNEVKSKICLYENEVVLDIGSNDATTLNFYPNTIRRIGIDPTGEQFRKYYNNLELVSDYFTKSNFINNFGNIKCKVVTSIAMFYDLPNPIQFAKDIYDILDDEGIWTCEQSYLIDMLKTNSLDTICHEHLEYYALSQIKYIATAAKLKIIDVKFNSSNGGSFRIYFAKTISNLHKECTELINEIIAEEDKLNIKDPATYTKFMETCNVELKKFTDFISCVNQDNKNIQIYGASTKGNCILQYCNITEEKIKYAVERNLEKIGKCTNTGIEIISEDTMRLNPPNYLVVLPWHFKEEIIKREEAYLNNGGQLIFYFPQFEIVSNLPKILITGCDGFIAHYIKEKFQAHSLYGITRTKKTDPEKKITKFYFDMCDYNQLENSIAIINPDHIIHLASTSSSIESFEHPFKTLENNGLLTAKLCEIILKLNKKIKLFNASSSEIYKGHLNFVVNDEINTSINHTHHIHPYSIAKIMGQQTVQFYRETYDLHFSNGILFTVQSKMKSDMFLLNKISKHIKNWNNGLTEPLTVGNLDSCRNIIHPADVASAIQIILLCDKGADYVISNYNNCTIFSFVEEMYRKSNILLIPNKDTTIWCEKLTNKPVLIVKNTNNGIDTTPIDIDAYPNKLCKLGWHIKYTKDDIMNELLN